MVNQIEYHPGYLQQDVVDYSRAHGLVVEAWSPLGCGRVLNDPRLETLARRLGVTTAQLALRFCLETGTLPLPKSVSAQRIRANLDVFGFEMPGDVVAAIRALPEFGFSGQDPDKVTF